MRKVTEPRAGVPTGTMSGLPVLDLGALSRPIAIPPTAREITTPLLAMARRAGLPEGHPYGAVAPGPRWPLNVVGKRDGKRRNAWPRRRRPRTPATTSRGT
jgi:hypothetical protein